MTLAFTLLMIVVIVRLTPKDLIRDLLREAEARHPAGTTD